ncbi:Tim10/DDP family zinc finger-domain-containing protein [Tricharina praecox]|uniref:Tim10/DDP family zinc finger-domain-containing protein n=1 Tax=Tricharina praecox TaxID=43433 RepID=UPI0022210029|nr:Tim10/DDP family zinc finger-domain-containing protein [Tricharina praecox]KAI5848213.1 Tim10/DDP family zinc finger-domain-containing protein [Tricharina praecox]
MENVSGMFGLNGNQSKEDKKQMLMQTLQQQQNIENARVLIDKINSNCFEKCVPKPGSSLSGGETTCLTNCMQKYMNAWNAVSSAYIFRIKSDPSSN